MSLIDTRRPVAAHTIQWKSRSTASQIERKPRAEVSTSMLQTPLGAGSSILEVARPDHADQHRCEFRRIVAALELELHLLDLDWRCHIGMVLTSCESAWAADDGRRWRAPEITHRTRGQQIAGGVSGIDAEVLRPLDHAAVTQVLDRTPSRCWPTAVKPATPRIASARSSSAAAQQQVGQAFLGQHMAHVVAVDHDRRQRHAGLLGQRRRVKRSTKAGCICSRKVSTICTTSFWPRGVPRAPIRPWRAWSPAFSQAGLARVARQRRRPCWARHESR